MSLSIRESVDSKASRLVREGRVTWAHGLAIVQGDHQSYVVRRTQAGWSCDCPWGTERPDSKPCSHIIAAALTAPTVQTPTPALNQAVNQILATQTVATSVPAPSHTVRQIQRSAAPAHRFHHPVRVDDPAHIEALRTLTWAPVQYIDRDGVSFAICEEATLSTALCPWRHRNCEVTQ